MAHNKIKKIPNLNVLGTLFFLDVSHNCIETIDPSFLPKSLQIFNMAKNPCCNEETIRKIKTVLPILEELNDERIVDNDSVKKLDMTEISDEKVENESRDIRLFACDILIRSQGRVEKSKVEHYQKMLELNKYKFLKKTNE
ncbi:hypothetical protein HELRODRAFT_171517 [Helobdella robusta]|uniref:U2A'/phosphoprotein 32 family A C-terminal domain-containing protein n=1 Tax=Helobdella robusta TaxID=6412 RepID=T1F4D2_HELRO|nr:hypothetical protein HELRODRAFT_171517 [Helobdella robusta]ESO05178.1 hypothetical protein HELRODRAFT_171517 [Helobdella robusta]